MTSPRSAASCNDWLKRPTVTPIRASSSAWALFGKIRCEELVPSFAQSKYASSAALRSAWCFASTWRCANSGPRKSFEHKVHRNFAPSTSKTKLSHQEVSRSFVTSTAWATSNAAGKRPATPAVASAASSAARRRDSSKRRCRSTSSLRNRARCPSNSTSCLVADSSASRIFCSCPPSNRNNPGGGFTSDKFKLRVTAISRKRPTTPLMDGRLGGRAAQHCRTNAAQSSGTPEGI
mmetsp:Transcript_86973/g.243798  ORF Transcript_86973/g.243798 Transcript_86973/m.243798 type:complete len:235 (-) Transcript_86973:1617-2321(-)